MDPRLLEAVRGGNVDALRKLLQEDSLILERGAVHHETVLHIAAMVGQKDFVRELLRLKPDFATRLDKDGLSAIHIASAVVTGRIRVIMELHGFFPACIGDVTPKGETTFHLAVKYNQFEAFKTMVDLSKEQYIKELLSAGDEDGNTVLHLAIARKQSLTLKLLLGSDGCPHTLVDVNVTNKSGLTALDVSDVIQQMVGEPADFMLRDSLLLRGALRASEVEEVRTSQVDHRQIMVTPRPPQTLWHFFLNEISLLNPWRYWRMLAKEVKSSPSQAQNALMVVALLIASMTFQAILSPLNGVYNDHYTSHTFISSKFTRIPPIHGSQHHRIFRIACSV